LDPVEIVGILAAGVAAGAVNTIVGSGSLITFPTLLAFGYPAVVANVSNTIGLVPGSASGAYGYRHRLTGQRDRMLALAPIAAAGGIVGAVLLLALPSAAFDRIVPILILVAVVLVALQPRLARRLAAHQAHGANATLPLALGVFGSSLYGGYFGAAQGVILIAVLAIFVADDVQRLNAIKNVLVMLVNGMAAIVFVIIAPVAWVPVLLIAIGSAIGGQLGAKVGSWLPAAVLRALIVVVGTAVAVRLLIA
jgi:uncharacterized membrane protein YfcA